MHLRKSSRTAWCPRTSLTTGEDELGVLSGSDATDKSAPGFWRLAASKRSCSTIMVPSEPVSSSLRIARDHRSSCLQGPKCSVVKFQERNQRVFRLNGVQCCRTHCLNAFHFAENMQHEIERVHR